MTLTIRVATRADAAELSRVGTQSFNDAYRGTANDEDIDAHLDEYFTETAIRAEMGSSTVRYLVAEYGASTTGLAKLRNSDVPGQLPVDSAVEVQQLYVASAHQRSGVGRRLMDAATAEARNWGTQGIWLSAWTQADWAIAFYRDYGFGVVCEVPFRLGQSEFTDYLMWYPFD
ncbi:MAG: N-acetyltransferase [Woeseiaceae bacterium]|nr:N-acetyltransferase [Woeseiaceae bacterium]